MWVIPSDGHVKGEAVVLDVVETKLKLEVVVTKFELDVLLKTGGVGTVVDPVTVDGVGIMKNVVVVVCGVVGPAV